MVTEGEGPMVEVIETYGAYSIKVDTPDGRMFVTVLENKDKKPFKILINIGKSGSALAAWADCVAELVSLSLVSNGLDFTIQKLMGIKSDKIAYSESPTGSKEKVPVHSGPEGIVNALVIYRVEKFREFMRRLGVSDDVEDDDEDHYRPPSISG